jgi:hypothetical protein
VEGIQDKPALIAGESGMWPWDIDAALAKQKEATNSNAAPENSRVVGTHERSR